MTNFIRPHSLKEYLGQELIKKQLSISIQAAKKRNESLDHILLFGPPGLGKTTLSHVIAHEMSSHIVETTGPVLEKAGDLASLLINLKENDILFIDEIHRIPIYIEEILYSVMEDFKINILIGDGNDKKTISLPIPKFTLIGATTRSGLISQPLHDRFGIIQYFEYYTDDELALIVQRTSRLLNVSITPDASQNIAHRSRGTPRIANRLLKRVRDLAEVKYQNIITQDVVNETLEMLQINHSGLNKLDQLLLKALSQKKKNKDDNETIGIETLSSLLGEDKGTLEDTIEPYLIQKGFIQKTPRGRQITEKGLKEIT